VGRDVTPSRVSFFELIGTDFFFCLFGTVPPCVTCASRLPGPLPLTPSSLFSLLSFWTNVGDYFRTDRLAPSFRLNSQNFFCYPSHPQATLESSCTFSNSVSPNLPPRFEQQYLPFPFPHAHPDHRDPHRSSFPFSSFETRYMIPSITIRVHDQGRPNQAHFSTA